MLIIFKEESLELFSNYDYICLSQYFILKKLSRLGGAECKLLNSASHSV